MKKVWPQPGDLGFVFVIWSASQPDYLTLSRRDEDGRPLMPVKLVEVKDRTPVIYLGSGNGRDIWFVSPEVYVQLVPGAQVTRD